MRAYNSKISKRANDSLRRREVAVTMQKHLIFVIAVLIVSVIIICSSTLVAFANNKTKEPVKSYTSIQIQSGDSLWTIADKYIEGTSIKRSDYISEVKELNSLTNDSIHSGEYLVVPTFTIKE